MTLGKYPLVCLHALMSAILLICVYNLDSYHQETASSIKIPHIHRYSRSKIHIGCYPGSHSCLTGLYAMLNFGCLGSDETYINGYLVQLEWSLLPTKLGSHVDDGRIARELKGHNQLLQVDG